MLKSLRLKDYQCYAEAFLEFCPGVNVIIGESDMGKSTCLRAIRTARFNKPAGLGMIRTGSGSKGVRGAERHGTFEITIVSTRDEQYSIVKRIRGHEENRYEVTLPGKKMQKFGAVNRDVPEDVLEALRLDDINIQKQISLPFLILESPGAVAAFLNRFTNLEEADKIVTILSSEVRYAIAEKDRLDKVVIEKAEALKKYSHLDAMGKLILRLGAAEVKEHELAQQIKGISEIRALIDETQHQQAAVEADITSRQAKLGKTKKALAKLEGAESKRQSIDSELNELSAVVRVMFDEHDREEGLGKQIPLLQKALKARRTQLELAEQYTAIGVACKDVADSIALRITAEAKQATEEALLIKAKASLEAVDECVLCGSALTAKTKATMMGNL